MFNNLQGERAMSRSRVILLMLLFSFTLSFARVIEYIDNTCPSDPTMNGKCTLKNYTTDNTSCKDINGQQICRDWWQKDYVYECSGKDLDNLYQSFLGQGYCQVVNTCSQWQDISQSGGEVSCRIYFDKRKPNCDSNPYKPECISDDCQDIRNKCTFEEYIPFGDITDKANDTTAYVCDAYGQHCSWVSVPASDIAGVQTGTFVYNCPASVRKVCKSYTTKLKCPAQCRDTNGKIVQVMCPDNSNQVMCPDGSYATCTEQSCNEVKTCKQYQQKTLQTTEIKLCPAPRNYQTYKVVKGSQDDINLSNNPNCVKTGEYITPCSYAVRTYGSQKFCELAGRHASIAGNAGQVFIGRNIPVPADVDLAVYIFTGNSCDDDNTRVDAFFKDSQTKQILGQQHTSCSITGQFFTLYHTTQNMYVDYKLKIAHTIGSGSGSNDYSFSDTETSTSWDYGGGTNWDSHDSSIGWKIYEYNIYQCYDNTIDTSQCNLTNCKALDNTSDLSSLACAEFKQDLDHPSKAICSKFNLQYECPATKTIDDCAVWEYSQVCNGVKYPIREVEVENKDYTAQFSKAMALAQLTNELRHIWSGRYMRCDSGWWSDVLENPLEYAKNKFIGYVVSTLGDAAFAYAGAFYDHMQICFSPATYGYTTTSYGGVDYNSYQEMFASCFQDGVKNAYAYATGNGDSAMVDFITNKLGLDPNGTIAQLLGNQYFMMGLSIAWDIISTTEQCNACNNKNCAMKHNQYDTYGLIKGKNCHYVEDGCAWKIDLGFTKICLRKKYYYCCYDSTFARILVEQAYKQLGYSFAGGNCSALTFDDIKRLDFNSMDWSELQQELQAKMNSSIDPNLIKNKINNYYDGSSGNIQWNGEVPYQN